MRGAVGVALVAAMTTVSVAQPSDADRDRAKALYAAAESAMKESRWDDAIRDYRGAWEITKDVALHFKLGSAHEKAGKCELAVTHYRRYLRDGKPTDKFKKLTRERIVACGGNPDAEDPPVAQKVEPTPPVEPPPPAPVEPAAEPAPEVPKPPPTTIPVHGTRTGWLLVGTAIGFVTIGAVLAYAAESSEADIQDLYTGLGGVTPTFDTFTRQRYDELVAQGERYERLSWIGFGIAGAAAIGAAIVFATTTQEDRIIVTPTASPTSAGAVASFSF